MKAALPLKKTMQVVAAHRRVTALRLAGTLVLAGARACVPAPAPHWLALCAAIGAQSGLVDYLYVGYSSV